MANAFNLVSRGVISQELCATSGDITQLIHFVCVFYAFETPLFYSHHNYDDNVTVIPFAMGTCQGDPLGRVLFVLIHLRALGSIINHFLLVYFHPLTSSSPLPLYLLHMSTFRLNFM
jgi:hypothetical protein